MATKNRTQSESQIRSSELVVPRPPERRSAGQVLKDFDEMMETIKPWMPPTVILPPPKPKPWKLSSLWPERKRHNDALCESAREKGKP